MPRVNKKVLGLCKDETNGKIIKEFTGLRSKKYSIKIQGENLIKKAKGLKTRVAKTRITDEHYKECLFENKIVKVHQNNIRSRLHVVRTENNERLV